MGKWWTICIKFVLSFFCERLLVTLNMPIWNRMSLRSKTMAMVLGAGAAITSYLFYCYLYNSCREEALVGEDRGDREYPLDEDHPIVKLFTENKSIRDVVADIQETYTMNSMKGVLYYNKLIDDDDYEAYRYLHKVIRDYFGFEMFPKKYIYHQHEFDIFQLCKHQSCEILFSFGSPSDYQLVEQYLLENDKEIHIASTIKIKITQFHPFFIQRIESEKNEILLSPCHEVTNSINFVMMRVLIRSNQCFTTRLNTRLSYYTCLYCALSTQNERYNLLNASSGIIELNTNWKSLHEPYKYPLFREYCKMIQMLSKFQKFSEISVVYEQLLNHISFPPQNIKKWRDFDISIHPMNVTHIMRCAKIANDWNTMYQFMQIYIKNGWKFNKVSARFALECCWRYKDETNELNVNDIEDTVTNIWNSLIMNNMADEYCFIHLLLNVKKQFININKINSLLLQILNDIKKSFPTQTITNKSLYMVIFDEMLQISDKHNLNDITIKIAQQILQPIGSNLFLSFSTSNVIQYVRYGKIPLRLIVKLLHFYDSSTNIEGTLQLFEVMKRFRSLSLQNMNTINEKKENNNNVLLRYWESEIFNEDILPIFIKIIYNHLFAMNDMTDLLLTRYINKAESICKYINYTINTPKASLYLCGIYYLSSNINTANILSMNVINKYFVNAAQENNEYLLKQWENGQFVLNLSKSLNIADIMHIPLILSSLIFYAKTIPKQDKPLKSIKIKLDIERLDEFEKLFEYLSLNYAPKIEYEIIGKIPNWNLVIELHLNSLLKWCEYHNIICFQDIDKQHMLNTTCLQLLPQIITDKQKNSIQSRKQLFKDIKTTLFQ